MKICFSVQFFVVVFFPEFVSWDCGGGSAVTLGGAPGGLWPPPPTSVFVSRLRITSRFQISIFVSKYRPCPPVNYWWGSGRHWNVYWPPDSSRTHSALTWMLKLVCDTLQMLSIDCTSVYLWAVWSAGALKCILRMRGAENLSLVTTTLCRAEQIQRGPSTSIIWCSSGNSVLYP